MRGRRIISSLLVGFVLGLSAAAASAEGGPGWRTFVSKVGRFQVELPAGPVVAPDERGSVMGPVVGRTYTARAGDLLLVVEARDLPPLARTLVPGDTILDAARRGVVASVHGVEVRGVEVVRQGFRARDVVYRLPGEQPVYERALVVLAGRRLYVVTGRASGPPGSSAALDRFFGSFRLWSDRASPAAVSSPGPPPVPAAPDSPS